jgi:hypothetical protein
MNRDTIVWLNKGRDSGASWSAHSITERHNRLESSASLLFTAGVNDSATRETLSYTSVVRTGAQAGFVVYARRLPGTPEVSFSMPFTVTGTVQEQA